MSSFFVSQEHFMITTRIGSCKTQVEIVWQFVSPFSVKMCLSKYQVLKTLSSFGGEGLRVISVGSFPEAADRK